MVGLKNAAKMVGKTFTRVAGRVSKSTLYKRARVYGRKFGRSMAKRVTSERWWGRAVRVLRSSRSFLGTVGKLGSALKKSGGILGLFGRGLSIFDADTRSPKEFRKSMRDKEAAVKGLREKRAALIKKEIETQKELEAPVVTEGIETPEEKIDELSKHLSMMKESIGVIRANTTKSSMGIHGFESYQIKANERLADAIDNGTQTNMKTVLTGLEDAKDMTQAVAASSTESIVGDISSKIDEIEDARKEEAEFRKKNNWKKKLLDFILFIADWTLNFKYKMIMLAVKIGAFITAALAMFYIANIVPIKALMSQGFTYVTTWIGAKITQSIGWMYEKFSGALGAVVKTLLTAITWPLRKIMELLSEVPWIGDFAALALNNMTAVLDKVKGGIDGLTKLASAGGKQLKEMAKAMAKAKLDTAVAVYKAEAEKKAKNRRGDSGALNSDDPNSVYDTVVSGSSDSTTAEVGEKEIKEDKKDNTEPKAVEDNEGGLMGKITSKVSDASKSAINFAAKKGNEYKVESKVVSAKDKALDYGTKGVNAVLDTADETASTKEFKKGQEETVSHINNLTDQVAQLGNAVKQAAVGGNGGGSAPKIIKEDKIMFEESANAFKSRV